MQEGSPAAMQPGLASAIPLAERRSAVRFPIEQALRYKVLKRNSMETGVGKTLNISSTGVLFSTERSVQVGDRLEVSVNWPAQLDHRCPLKFVTAGRVVRTQAGTAAIAIDRCEFRTQGSHGLA